MILLPVGTDGAVDDSLSCFLGSGEAGVAWFPIETES